MDRKVWDIVDGALFETADVDKLLEILREPGFAIVRQAEWVALK
jgi:hypothetical protein